MWQIRVVAFLSDGIRRVSRMKHEGRGTSCASADAVNAVSILDTANVG
jgi:hypothetical protein